MDLRQLHALLAVAEHRSFSAAARALHTVQSNVSTHVARLEQEVGATLIERSRGELTHEGEVVAARAHRILAELRSIEHDLTSLRDDVAGHVRLGMIGTTARWLVQPFLVHLAEIHPSIDVVLIEATTTSLLPQIITEHLDAAVINLPVDDPDVDARPLFDEDRIIVAPTGHPLAARERVTLAEAAGHELLLPPTGTAFRDEIDTDARRARVTLRPLAEIDGLRLLASLAFQGFGAALLPASAAPRYLHGDWTRVGVDGLSPRAVGVAVPRRSPPSAPTRAVIDTLGTLIAEIGPDHAGIHPLATES
ncbi:MAG: LysR family transcriptional regulator [Acidimicrobiales bacterium]|nr:LysR family transcriptional regulator [Acidimicrobiales bacterium]